jgi:hypothetical protein
MEVGLDGSQLPGEDLSGSGLGGERVGGSRGQSPVDLGEDAASEVHRLGEGLELLVEGVGPGRDGLGLERLHGKGHRHLPAEDGGHVVLEREDVDQEDLLAPRDSDDLSTNVGVSGAQGMRGVGGAKSRRPVDRLPVDLEPIAHVTDSNLVPVQGLERTVLRVRAELKPSTADDDSLIRPLAHPDPDRHPAA